MCSGGGGGGGGSWGGGGVEGVSSRLPSDGRCLRRDHTEEAAAAAVFAHRIVLGFPFVLESFSPPPPLAPRRFYPSWFTRLRREGKCAATS